MIPLIFLSFFITDVESGQNPIQLANQQMLADSVQITVQYISSLEKTVLDSLEKETQEVTESTEELLKQNSGNNKRITFLREQRLKEVNALKHLARSFADAARMDVLNIRGYVSWYMELNSMTNQLMSSYRIKMQAVLDENEKSHELFEKKLDRGAIAVDIEDETSQEENGDKETKLGTDMDGETKIGDQLDEISRNDGKSVQVEDTIKEIQGSTMSKEYKSIKAVRSIVKTKEGSGEEDEII